MEQQVSDKDLIRFMSKVKSFAPGECWEWGAQVAQGYGKFKYNDLSWFAHRFSYWITTGEEPGESVCHTCDNPSCVNPEHLVSATRDWNNKDRDKKGRHHNTNQTHCKHGHEFTEENTYWYVPKDRNKRRHCKRCGERRQRSYRNRH